MSFTSLGLPAMVVKGARAIGHPFPSLFQGRAIPAILAGNDVILCRAAEPDEAAAYLLPVLARLLEVPRGLRALILCPTRERALELESKAHGCARLTGVRVGAFSGGAGVGMQKRRIKEQGVDLLFAVPDRLLDLCARQDVKLDDIELLVFDRADDMVAAGLAAMLSRIVKLLPETRQTLLLCSTLTPELNRIAREALLDPVRIEEAPSEEDSSAASLAG